MPSVSSCRGAGVGITTLIAVLIGTPCALGYTVEISQPSQTTAWDIPTEDRTGQTFIAESNQMLVGVKLLVQGQGWSGDYPEGSGAVVRLRSLGLNGIPLETPLAEGSFTVDDISMDQLQWVTVLFDDPYQQTAGQTLAFMVDGMTGGGSEGWNDYGMSRGNPYAGGSQFYLSYNNPFDSDYIQINADIDFTFETLVEPSSYPGDLNGDGLVGLADLDVLLRYWNRTIPPWVNLDPNPDLSGDGYVGLDDLDIMLVDWHQVPSAGAPAGIPEPGSLCLLATAGTVLTRARRVAGSQ